MNIFEREYRQPKGHMTSGTHRTRGPQDTFAEYSKYLATMGITRLANVTGLDRIGIPVYVAIRPNSRSLATSQGKGADKHHARVSAMMESVENWHAEHIELPIRMESYWRLSNRAPVIDVFDIPLRGNQSFRPELPMPWIEGQDLLSQAPVWMPYECVTLNTVCKFALRLTFYTSSNGLASGNHILEAINHALFEVIERDSHAQWVSRSRELRLETKVDPYSITDPWCQEMLDRFERARIRVAIWDVTSPAFGIPVYVANILARDEDMTWRRLSVTSGSGCHLSPAVALSRALSEAAQSRLTLISGSRDDNLPQMYETHNSESRFEKWTRENFDPPAVVRFGEHKDRATDSFESDLELILSALKERGVQQVAVVDLSQIGIGIPVVKVVVPGLAIANEHGQRVAVPASIDRNDR